MASYFVILLVDNYDSFVHNLARYFVRLGQETLVVRNDRITIPDIRRCGPQAIVLSPGPCTPAEAGCSVSIVDELSSEFPILGVCLGHQAIASALGARVVRAKEPRHGRTSSIVHDGSGLFTGVPSPFSACRYHSLVVDDASLPAELHATAHTEDGVVMAIAHARLPLYGVQFHPESTMTDYGYPILANFLRLAGCRASADFSALQAAERFSRPRLQDSLPLQPITF